MQEIIFDCKKAIKLADLITFSLSQVGGKKGKSKIY